MTCRKCGNQVPGNCQICPKCGNVLYSQQKNDIIDLIDGVDVKEVQETVKNGELTKRKETSYERMLRKSGGYQNMLNIDSGTEKSKKTTGQSGNKKKQNGKTQKGNSTAANNTKGKNVTGKKDNGKVHRGRPYKKGHMGAIIGACCVIALIAIIASLSSQNQVSPAKKETMTAQADVEETARSTKAKAEKTQAEKTGKDDQVEENQTKESQEETTDDLTKVDSSDETAEDKEKNNGEEQIEEHFKAQSDRQETGTKQDETAQTTATASTSSVREDEKTVAERRSRYADMLSSIGLGGSWPEEAAEEISYEALLREENEFSIMDIDEDGIEELLVLVSAEELQGCRLAIYQFDPDTQQIQIEYKGNPKTVIYEKGLLMEETTGYDETGELTSSKQYYQYGSGSDTYEKVEEETLSLTGTPLEAAIAWKSLSTNQYRSYVKDYQKLLLEDKKAGRTEEIFDLGETYMEHDGDFSFVVSMLSEQTPIELIELLENLEWEGSYEGEDVVELWGEDGGYIKYKNQEADKVRLFGVYPGMTEEEALKQLSEYGFSETSSSFSRRTDYQYSTGDAPGSYFANLNVEDGIVQSVSAAVGSSFSG